MIKIGLFLTPQTLVFPIILFTALLDALGNKWIGTECGVSVFHEGGIKSNSKRFAHFDTYFGYIEVPNTPSLTFSEFTIEFWLRVTKLGDPNYADGEQTILDMRGDNNTGLNFRLAGTSFPISLFAIALPGDVSVINAIKENVWHHIAISQDKTKLKIYLNGKLMGESSNSYAYNTNSPLRIGDYLGYPNGHLGLHGDLDEMSIWNNAHSQSEIQSEMNKKFTGKENGLVAYWNFNDEFNKAIADLSPNGNNGTINGYISLIDSDELYSDVNESAAALPKEFALLQNYPNPFNPTTTIKYKLKSREFVTLKIYDILGRVVTTLINEEKPAGNYEVIFNLQSLASGIYFYRLKAGGYTAVKKMILMK